ncbi:hypothetical protein [Rhizobium sp. C1]|uniref:hypothetical protein n=1 Tax=Rhizobium sp. C1 TaxID=1349799 RepID=UPI001E4D6566|nr:hypothetical protein [Rhizobium sp. C1]MCD2176469.1 hypothetical protein [Rhizobium sp. C1]
MWFKRFLTVQNTVVIVFVTFVLGACLWLVVPTIPETSPFWSRAPGEFVSWLGMGPDRSTARWIYKYQGMLAGVLAVFAALCTIIVMVVVEGRANQRHREVISLSFRPDWLRLERVERADLAGLREICTALASKELPNLRAVYAKDREAEKVVRSLRGWAAAATYNLRGSRWADAQQVMDADLLAAYTRFDNGIGKLETSAAQLCEVFAVNMNFPDDFIEDNYAKAEEALRELPDLMTGLDDRFQRLMRRYAAEMSL